MLESRTIDETSEWRIFANESSDNDSVCVDDPTNPLLTDGGLSTIISKPNGVTSNFLSSLLGRWQNRRLNLDRTLILAFKKTVVMSDTCKIMGVEVVESKLAHVLVDMRNLMAMVMDGNFITVEAIVPNTRGRGKRFKIPCQVHILASIETFTMVKLAIPVGGLHLISDIDASLTLSRAGVVKEKKNKDDKSVDEIATVYNTLKNIENLIEVKPSVAEMVCERTKLKRWLLGKIKI
ncbi:hypothetical protein F0562_032299 [Nyssa sinensis]|uniref:Beta-catenin-like protein 1 N-terminal domain-containing protein n=1 Tax=Nyssa sinensis TaxID=561372 RepID=A0A5J5AR34_9ASTE|nr:hypothetical protein F0562_032299 [Nyssa sinensis]